MGDVNQQQLVLEHKDKLFGPYLEIGSRNYGSTQDLRSLFPGDTYIGLDISDGDGVDIVLDLTQPFEVIDEKLGKQRFGTIFSFSVMEHCDNPFLMAENMVQLLKPGGKIVLSVPFAWQFHGYPSDYWRFTSEGVKKLFPRIDWNDGDADRWHTPTKGDFRALDESIGKVHFSGKHYRKRGMLLRGLSADFLKIIRSLGLLKWLLGYRYLMTPTMIDMIGVLRDEA